MNPWDAVNDLVDMEKMGDLLKSYQNSLELKRIYLERCERFLTSGKYAEHGLTPQTAQEEIKLLEESIDLYERRITWCRQVLDKGPEACRAGLQQVAADTPDWMKQMEQALEPPPEPPAPPPQPQVVRRVPGGGGVGADAATGDAPAPQGPVAGEAGGAGAPAAGPEPPPIDLPAPNVIRVPGGVGPEVPTGGPAAAAPEPPTIDAPAPNVVRVPGGVGPEVPTGGPAAAAPEPPTIDLPAPQIARVGVATGEEIAGTGVAEAEALSLGRLLVGALIVGVLALGAAAGAYTAYNHFTSRPPMSSQHYFPLTGDYNGAVTLEGSSTGTTANCSKPQCYVTIVKTTAHGIQVTFTSTAWQPAFNGATSYWNQKVGPMAASLTRDGKVQGSGTTTLADTSGQTVTVRNGYTLNGNISGLNSDSPSYNLTINLSGLETLHMTGARIGPPSS